jgi:hypothetical protein
MSDFFRPPTIDIHITSPTTLTVQSPFHLQANSTSCKGQSTASMAFSFDDQQDTIFSGATSIDTSASASNGSHILRVKAWGSGTFCEVDLNITVGAPPSINMNNLKIRVERPDRIHDPQNGSSQNCNRGKDNFFNEFQLLSGNHRGFTANGSKDPTVGSTCSTDGIHSYDMDGPVTPVVFPNTSYASCGFWLETTIKSGTTLYGFAHAETNCNYPATTKSMALLTSDASSDATAGKTWTEAGQIISKDPNSQTSTEKGEGDCTVATDSSYYYMYCRRVDDLQTAVARAPVGSLPGPGSWTKYNNGSWSQPGLLGSDSPLGKYGSSSSIWTDNGSVVLLNSEFPGDSIHGLKMSFSTDKTTFAAVPEPVIYQDDYVFPSSPSRDSIFYPSALDSSSGSRNWSGFFLLTYTFVPPTSAPDNPSTVPDQGRTLVMRNVSVSVDANSQNPHVGVALSRWFSSAIQQKISSTEIVPYNFFVNGYVYEQRTAYVMTVPPAQGSNTLVECVSTASYPSAANPDHLLNAFASNTTPANNGCDTHYQFLRTAGYLYQSSQGANTVPVYRCKPDPSNPSASKSHFNSTDINCEGLGLKEYLLGYGLAN